MVDFENFLMFGLMSMKKRRGSVMNSSKMVDA
jgi:hypothetical protein